MSVPEFKLPDDGSLDGVSLGNPEVIRLLEGLLTEAKAGRVAAIGVVRVGGPAKVSASAAGGFLMEVYTGCGMLQDLIIKTMTGSKSPILRM